MSISKNHKRTRHIAFSLVELLITLVIMGILAACTIPTLFQVPAGKNNTKQSSMAKDVAFMIVSAYERYRTANPTVPTTFTADDLMAYMNYVQQLPSTQKLDSHANTGGIQSSCAGGTSDAQAGKCYLLHNGAALWTDTGNYINGSTTLNAVMFRFDPNATWDGSVNDASGMGMQIALYYDGYIRSRGNLRPNTINKGYDGVTHITTASGNEDPSWFTGF